MLSNTESYIVVINFSTPTYLEKKNSIGNMLDMLTRFQAKAGTLYVGIRIVHFFFLIFTPYLSLENVDRNKVASVWVLDLCEAFGTSLVRRSRICVTAALDYNVSLNTTL